MNTEAWWQFAGTEATTAAMDEAKEDAAVHKTDVETGIDLNTEPFMPGENAVRIKWPVQALTFVKNKSRTNWF